MSEVKGTKALELWCKRLVRDCPNVQIDNMTTSWRNGMAFCALVHHFRPDLIDLTKLDPKNVYENNQLAYSIAEKHLGIPALLDPEDMVENDVPDRLSILTYLSQFYQRLGHTVNTKVSESESKSSPSSQNTTQIKFGKIAMDKCAVCGLPVYLAQRLMVSQKLYHRQCFRCSKCSGHLNPKHFHVINETEFSCDTCKNEKNISKYLNNNEQMGMLAFTNDTKSGPNQESPKDDVTIIRDKTRPKSILEKINMFENIDKDTSIESKLGNHSLKDDNVTHFKYKDIVSSKNNDTSDKTDDKVIQSVHSIDINEDNLLKNKELSYVSTPEKVYKSNIEKFNFLQTQLSDDLNLESKIKEIIITDTEVNVLKESLQPNEETDCTSDVQHNITDDSRLAKCNNSVSHIQTTTTDTQELNNSHEINSSLSIENDEGVKINVPPRRKKLNIASKKVESIPKENTNKTDKDYPEYLNPFSDDDDEEEIQPKESKPKVSTNPFGSSDEEDDEVPPIQSHPKAPDVQSSTSIKRHITAYNPFWSDGEEPTTDEESENLSNMHKSPITASTPNLPSSAARRRKPKAPPPPALCVTDHDLPSTSMDDVASLSSVSSHTSAPHSDHKTFGKLTPTSKKKRPAPTPPDSLSTLSGCAGSLERGVDMSMRSNVSDSGRKSKGPAPGLPLPERREVKMQMSPEQLQVQLDLLETQQLGLERQGVLIEQMIRDKCEGDEAVTVPQEEIEDLVIQLCELVNEKNDLFRKQTELMYIRRQQRLEQEQADIEHEIRVIQSRPAVNRIDADKAREEQLVCRLVEIVRMRDELVQQIDAERRRERQEDLAIAASIASKRAQRNSDSNSSSIKSAEIATPVTKNKVKDKVKKQLKKAKHTLIAKKKDDEKKDKMT